MFLSEFFLFPQTLNEPIIFTGKFSEKFLPVPFIIKTRSKFSFSSQKKGTFEMKYLKSK